MLLQPGHPRGQLSVAQLFTLAVFADRHQRRMRIAATQQVGGKIQLGTGKPLRAGHGIRVFQHPLRRGAEVHRKEVRHRLPEVGNRADAPLMQRGVIGQRQSVALINETPEGIHPAGRNPLGRRPPQGFAHACSRASSARATREPLSLPSTLLICCPACTSAAMSMPV